MTKKKHVPRDSALLGLVTIIGLSLLARWHIVSREHAGTMKQHLESIHIAAPRVPRTCQYQGSVHRDVAAAFSSIATVDALQAPHRTDDHKTEHTRLKDVNEQAINSLFASLQGNISSMWDSALMPLLDSGCDTIHLNSVQESGRAADVATVHTFTSKSSRNSGGMMQQQQQQMTAKRTAMLLVSDQRSRFKLHLESYPVQLATLWFYAKAYNYALEIYTHNEALPAHVTGHFVKIKGVQRMFDLGYDYVLGMDWDMYITPFTAVPLSLFFSEWPRASILVQGEHNMCTGAVLYRHSEAAVRHLQHWWNLALTGCCWRGPLHDQVAFKHMLQGYLANLTGNSSFYPPEEQMKLAKNRSPHTTHPAQLLAMKQQLQTSSDFGFVALEMMFDDHHNYPRVALHSCHGLFWGCIPENAPALLMHTGHKRAHLAWIQHRMLTALRSWMMMFAENGEQPYTAAAAAAAADGLSTHWGSTHGSGVTVV